MIVGPLAELEEEMMMADGFDDAVIGIGQRCGQEDDAREHMDFNVTGSHMGSKTPLFMISA